MQIPDGRFQIEAEPAKEGQPATGGRSHIRNLSMIFNPTSNLEPPTLNRPPSPSIRTPQSTLCNPYSSTPRWRLGGSPFPKISNLQSALCNLLLLLFLFSPLSASAQEYLIGPRDVLKITVWGQQDLSQNYNVSADGKIVFPLIGDVQAAGLTAGQLGQKIATLLEKDYLVNPQVLVSVAEFKSKKVLVLGEAEKPGLYPLTGETTLLEIVSQAGGFSKTAGKQLVMIRPNQRVASAGQTEVTGNTIRRLSIDKIQAGDSSENVAVEDGDTIIIPKANAFFVLGEVKTPGTYVLEKDTNILEAVTIAGGFTTRAAPMGAKVIRKLPDGTQETLSVDLSGAVPAMRNFRIQDGDSVLIPRGNTFFVFGEVKKPGDYQLEKDTTILEAISIAGGFTDKAAPARTKIIRTTPKGQETIDVDMNVVIKQGRREKAVPLKENDVIVVPESFF